jgi:hypothetical protein
MNQSSSVLVSTLLRLHLTAKASVMGEVIVGVMAARWAAVDEFAVVLLRLYALLDGIVKPAI